MKKLFSRFSLVALTIILMFVVMVALFAACILLVELVFVYRFPQSETAVRIVAAVLDWLLLVLVVLHIANRDMVPEAKVPWLVCIIALNVFGAIIYITFSSRRPSKKQRTRYKSLYAATAGKLERKLGKEETAGALGKWSGLSEALYAESSEAVLYTNTKTDYYPSGEKFAEALLKDLEKAERYIFLEYFIIERGALWDSILEVLERKVKAGLDVRVMYDDVGCIGKLPTRYHKKLQKIGIKCKRFNPFIPIVTNVHNNRDHRKIAIIDGKVGYTGGINLADEYVNLKSPFGHWKDIAVRLEGEGVKNLVSMFLLLYNLQSKTEEDVEAFLPEQYEAFENEGFVQAYGDGPRPLYDRQIAEDVYINVLSRAKRYVYITTPYLIIDYRMREALVLAAKRGVDVRLLTPHIPDKKLVYALTRSNYLALIRGGVKIYEYTPGFNHAKGFVADGEVAVIGTVNLDYRSLLFHFENAVALYFTRAVKEMEKDMEEVFEVSERVTEKDAKRNVVHRGLCELAKLFAPLF